MNSTVKILGALVVLFVVATLIEYNTTPEGLNCDVHGKLEFITSKKDLRYNRSLCKRQVGAVSRKLDVLLQLAWDFFEAVGRIIARISDFLYWFEEYLWSIYAILERLLQLAFSWWQIFTGYVEYIKNANGARIFLGTCILIAVALIPIEYKWHTVSYCCHVIAEDCRQTELKAQRLDAARRDQGKSD